jgi:hypothetical protein
MKKAHEMLVALRELIGEVNLGLPNHHIPSWGRQWSLQLQGVWRNKKPFNVRYLYLGGHHVPQSQERCCVRIHPLPPWSAGACLQTSPLPSNLN